MEDFKDMPIGMFLSREKEIKVIDTTKYLAA